MESYMPVFFSIIIPIYNGEKHLPKCINSLIKQTEPNFEVLLVNDGSTDNSKEICLEYISKDKRFRFIDKMNSGVSDTRNYGLQAAKGQWIVFLDCDDMLPNSTLKHYRDVIERYPCVDYVSGCMSKIDESDNILANYINKQRKGYYSIEEYVNKKDYSPSGVWGYAFKNQIIKERNIKFDNSLVLGEDFLLRANYIKYVKRIYMTSETTYYYRINPNSVTNTSHSLHKAISQIEAFIKVVSLKNDDITYNFFLKTLSNYMINVTLINIAVADYSFKEKKVLYHLLRKFCKTSNDYSIIKLLMFYYKRKAIGFCKHLSRLFFTASTNNCNIYH